MIALGWEQAKARINRIGQTKQTLVIRLMTPGTVEEKMLRCCMMRVCERSLYLMLWPVHAQLYRTACPCAPSSLCLAVSEDVWRVSSAHDQVQHDQCLCLRSRANARLRMGDLVIEAGAFKVGASSKDAQALLREKLDQDGILTDVAQIDNEVRFFAKRFVSRRVVGMQGRSVS